MGFGLKVIGLGAAAAFLPPPVQWKQLHRSSCADLKKNSLSSDYNNQRRESRSIFPVAGLFGPTVFEASKLKVVFSGGVDRDEQRPATKVLLPRTYTLTHSDVTSSLSLAISHTVNYAQLQGWYKQLQRDEVVAEWKKIRGQMSLHVHCHISGGHFLLTLLANLRYRIFCKELPVVLKAFVHGDETFFSSHPELEEATVWVYFHSDLPEFNRVECWGPLKDASSAGRGAAEARAPPRQCEAECDCCSPRSSLIPWPDDCER